MKPARTRWMVATCLLVSLLSAGCSSGAAGRALAQVLVGVASVAASAALEGALKGGRGGGDSDPASRPRLSPCRQQLADWRELHPEPGALPPPSIRCTVDGDWPEVTVASYDEASEPAARTDVTEPVCGGTETDRQACEAEDAPRVEPAAR